MSCNGHWDVTFSDARRSRSLGSRVGVPITELARQAGVDRMTIRGMDAW